jgi:hypothetical protein
MWSSIGLIAMMNEAVGSIGGGGNGLGSHVSNMYVAMGAASR